MSEEKSTGVKKERKRANTYLLGEQGQTLQITAQRKDPTSVVVFVTRVSKDAAGKRQKLRGASSSHPSMEAAQAQVARLAAKAEKDGWKTRQKSGGFVSKPDAFDAEHIPGPRPIAKK